jgi:putative transcriptional regulator
MAWRDLNIVVALLVVLVPWTSLNADTNLSAITKDRDTGPDQIVAPDKGVFLVANPTMRDPRFQRTVVLLLEHNDKGTLGVIINRPTEMLLSHALPDLKGAKNGTHTVFFGGPVGLNTLVFLLRSSEPPQASSHVMADVYYSADRNALESALNQRKKTNELRMFFGHAGWAPGQLAGELLRGDWLLVRADSHSVFEKKLDALWQELIDRGPTRELIVNAMY